MTNFPWSGQPEPGAGKAPRLREWGRLAVLGLLLVLAFLSVDSAVLDFRYSQRLFYHLLIAKVPPAELAQRAFLSGALSLAILAATGLVSWRRYAQEALWEGERLLASIFASVQEGLIIKDADFNVIRVNPVVEGWFAHALPVVGKKCYQAFRGQKEPCEGCPSREALETGRPAHAEVPKFGPGGEGVGWLDLYAFPLTDPYTGQRSGVIEFLRDITERKEAEAALRESEARHRSLVENINLGITLIDSDYRILMTNAAQGRMFKKPPGDFVHRHCFREFEKRETVCEHCPGTKAMATGLPAEAEVEGVRDDGSRITAHIFAFPTFGADGQVSGFVEVVEDVTDKRRAEAALRESEARYRLLVNNIPAVVFKGYLDWTLDLVDDKIQELTGYSQEDFNSRRLKWTDVMLPEDLEAARQVFRQALKTTRQYVREYRIRHKDGRILWIQARGQILCDLEGKVEYISGVFFDITEHKMAEEALRQSRASLAEAQRIAHLGNWEWHIPTDELHWSDEIYRIFGLTPQQFGATYQAFLDAVHPEDRLKVQETVNRALYQGQPFHMGHRILRPDGQERFVYEQGEVTFDAGGRPLRMLGTVQDITEIKAAQSALGESERRYRLLAENVTDVIWTMGLDLKFTYVSPSVSLFTGYTPEEAQTLSLEEILTPASLELAKARLGEELARGQAHPEEAPRSAILELEHRAKDGGTVWAEVKASFLKDARGNFTGILGVSRDITGRKELEEQLRQAQKMEVVGRLAGGVAHDFNNLLTAILGYSELLDAALEEGAPGRQDVLEIKKAGERAALLTRQLLAFSRRQVLKPKLLNLNKVVENLGRMLKRVIGEDIELAVVPGPGLGLVRADPGQMEQVVLNLALNARDAMPQGGRLTITTANAELDEEYCRLHPEVAPGPYVLLSVSDTGCGMDAATAAKIFEPFFTTKEVGKGTGLGLSMVYGIIRQSGGHVWVDSKPGQGTTFKIYLPRVEAAPETVAREGMPPAPLRGRETILLVEDEPVVRQVARRILTTYGYTVLEAGSGPEALQVLEDSPVPVHLALTDVVMPGMNGRELARELSARRPEMKVLYMSGYAGNGIVHQGVLEEGVAYIQKPFEARALARLVRELLDASGPATDG